MTRLAIKVEGLSKEYVLGGEVTEQMTFREMLMGAVTEPMKRLRRLQGRSTQQERFWALKDVNFTVNEGEVVGIIGANGAGKSTLLKLLSRITAPTEGNIQYRGRIASLLEVGTGFHPELSGRENIFINGAILGMTKSEIRECFDEIVEFAGIGKFLDTPVKRYSSGMYVRLAFAVAAHLDTDILIVDEVLAVGDAEFQKKCLGKMNQVALGGRTVLFVSHNMGMVAQLCTRALWIEDGRVSLTGDTNDVIRAYLSSARVGSSTWVHPRTECCGPEAQLKSARVMSLGGQPREAFGFDEHFKLVIAYEVIHPRRDLAILFRLTDLQGNILWTSWDTDAGGRNGLVRKPGDYVSICTIPGKLLRPGRYTLSIGSHSATNLLSYHENVIGFDVAGSPLNPGRIGILTPLLAWEIMRDDGGGRYFDESSNQTQPG